MLQEDHVVLEGEDTWGEEGGGGGGGEGMGGEEGGGDEMRRKQGGSEVRKGDRCLQRAEKEPKRPTKGAKETY